MNDNHNKLKTTQTHILIYILLGNVFNIVKRGVITTIRAKGTTLSLFVEK